jgi:hypothetical protein
MCSLGTLTGAHQKRPTTTTRRLAPTTAPMNIQPSPIRGVLLGTLAVFVLTLCSSLAAERKAALPNEGQLLEISTVVIKPEKIAEYERIQKEEVNPALKKAGWTARYFFQGGTLNGAYRFGTAVPIPNFGYFDEKPLEKALGKPAAEELIRRIAACHISKQVFVTRQVPDLCWGQTFAPVVVVTYHRLAATRRPEWLRFMREHYAPAARRSDMLGFHVEEVLLGGGTDDAYTLGYWRNYADLDKGSSPVQVLGRQGFEKMMRQLPPGVVLEREAHVIEFREDMSFGPNVTKRSTPPTQ